MKVDGNDVEAVFEAAREAVERARSGGGPTLIECGTMRMHGHGAHDDMSYVPEELLERVGASATRSSATPSGWSPSTGSRADEVDEIRAEVEAYVERVRADGARLADARSGGRDRRACSPSAGSRSATASAPWSRWADGEAGNGAPHGSGGRHDRARVDAASRAR